MVEERLKRIVKDAEEVLKDEVLKNLVEEWIGRDAKIEGSGKKYYKPENIIFFLKFLKDKAKKGEKPSETFRRLFVENERWSDNWENFSTWLYYQVVELFEGIEIPFHERHEFYKTCHFTAFTFVGFSRTTYDLGRNDELKPSL